MPLHSTTRVPVDDQYAALVGKAVYVFAYFEWTIMWVIELLENGFISEYCRGNPMASGKVAKYFREVIDNPATSFAKVSKQELNDCLNRFSDLIVQRNALIHAHPCTNSDGAQILAYQTKPSKLLSDMKWPAAEVEKIISIFDEAACSAGEVLEGLRN